VSDIAKGLRDEKIQMTPLCGEPEDGDFVGPDADKFGDAFSDGSEGKSSGIGGVGLQGAGQTLEFGDEIEAYAHDKQSF